MTFVQRKLRASFTLSGGRTFDAASGGNTVEVKDLRASAKINKAGANASTLSMRIFGMQLSTMNQLSTLGYKINLIEQNQITVSAGDAGDEPAVVFVGGVMMAFVDLSNAPDVAFDITGNGTGNDSALSPMQPTSIRGSADVASMMSTFAQKLNVVLENSGVNLRIANPYLTGSAWEQAKQLADQVGINIVQDNGKLAIWPKRGARGGAIPLVSKATGMIQSPVYTATGIQVRTLFNPSITFGSQIRVESETIPSVNKVWSIIHLAHDLEEQVPNGQWASTIDAIDLSAPQPTPAAS